MSKNDNFFIFFTLLTMALAFAATDIYLPALPSIKIHLGATTAVTQYSLSSYLFGLATAQIITGPLIEYLGYRRILLPAVFSFIAITVGCALSPNIFSLVLFRGLQGFSTGILAVISRASFVRRFTSEETQHIFVTWGPAVILTSVIAPALGGFIVKQLSWRYVFVFLILYGVILAVGQSRFFFVQEQTPSSALNTKNIVSNYLNVLCHRAFMQYLVINSMYLAIIFSYAAQAPFIYHLNGLSSTSIGYTFIPIALAFLVASQINKHIYNRVSFNIIVLIAFTFVTLGMCLMGYPTHMIPPTYKMLIGITLATFGMGFSSPVAFSRALTQLPKLAGYASSILASAPFIFSTCLTYIVHKLCGTDITHLAIFLESICVSAVFIYVVLHMGATRKTSDKVTQKHLN